MGKVVKIEDYKNNQALEKEYLDFLTYINKYLKIPTDVPALIRNFYFTLRYLEGTVNSFTILSLIKQFPPEHVEGLKRMVITYLDGIIKDLENC